MTEPTQEVIEKFAKELFELDFKNPDRDSFFDGFKEEYCYKAKGIIQSLKSLGYVRLDDLIEKAKTQIPLSVSDFLKQQAELSEG